MGVSDSANIGAPLVDIEVHAKINRRSQVPFDDLVAHLEKIAKLEGAELPKETIERIARQASGSVRGALNRLEREL